MKRWVFLILGALLALTGVVWTLQGFDVLGQNGGMNGEKIFIVIGLVVAIIGVVLVVVGARTSKDRTPAA